MIIVKNVSMVLAAASRSITILDRITFEIAAKQTVAIVGPSGSGKSTLLGLMAGLDRPTTGSIQLDGTDITTMGESQMARFRREKVGYIFQSFHLIPTLTAIENVAVPLELSGVSRVGDRAGELLDRSDCPTVWSTIRFSYPGENNNGSRWPGLSPAGRPSYWRMSRQGTSTVLPVPMSSSCCCHFTGITAPLSCW